MKSRRRPKSQSRYDRCNTPGALRRRSALADARREALAATLPPACTGPEPWSLWQVLTVRLYVPASGRCDQHAVELDGERLGLMAATDIGRQVAARARKRPSLADIAEVRRDDLAAAAEEI